MRYDALAEVSPSPVVELNRGVAHAFAHGPERGLEIVDALADVPALKDYHLLPSVRGSSKSLAVARRRRRSFPAPPK